MKIYTGRFAAVLLGLFFLTATVAFAQTTAFTYQGKLTDGGAAANNNYDMQFRLFDVAGAGQGTQQGMTFTPSLPVVVSGGIFTVQLDFGAAVFASGADRFLEISLRPAGSTGGYTSLAPRQRLTSAPYSVRSREATTADNLSSACAGCVQDANINSIAGNKVTGTVANATNATTAGNVSGIVAIANGGTGSATQNFVDLTTDQTIDGNKTFNGTVSAGTFSGNGAGLTNVIRIQTFSGFIGSIPASGSTFVFAGNITTTVTVNGNQRITGSSSAVLRNPIVGAGTIIDLCYQSTSGGTVVNFSGPNFLNPTITNNYLTHSVASSVVPLAGEYRVGFCLATGSPLDNREVQGWIMVTNN